MDPLRGEIKKAIFTIMNHILPAKGLLPMHCSANTDGTNSALFFGLSGTENTFRDPDRALVGMMNMDGLKRAFNFEGGCYAANQSIKERRARYLCHHEDEGYNLENVVLNADGTRTWQ